MNFLEQVRLLLCYFQFYSGQVVIGGNFAHLDHFFQYAIKVYLRLTILADLKEPRHRDYCFLTRLEITRKVKGKALLFQQ